MTTMTVTGVRRAKRAGLNLEVQFSDNPATWWLLPGFFVTNLPMEHVDWDHATVRVDGSGLDIPLKQGPIWTTPEGQAMLAEEHMTTSNQIRFDTEPLRRKVEWIKLCKEDDAAPLTADEMDSLMQLWAHTTPGRWHARATRDDSAMNARYVGLDPNPLGGTKLSHDRKYGMAVPIAGTTNQDQEPSGKVIAITLLQSPRMADTEEHDANTKFIAEAHQAFPRLLRLIYSQSEQIQALEHQRDALAQAAGIDINKVSAIATRLTEMVMTGGQPSDEDIEALEEALQEAEETRNERPRKQDNPARQPAKPRDNRIPGFHTPPG